MKKVFVLRTESLLASKNPTLRFGDDNTIVIPMAILQNLYRYNGVPEKKSLASQLIEYIDNIHRRICFLKKVLNRVTVAVCELWITVLFLRRLQTLRTFLGLTTEFIRFAKT